MAAMVHHQSAGFSIGAGRGGECCQIEPGSLVLRCHRHLPAQQRNCFLPPVKLEQSQRCNPEQGWFGGGPSQRRAGDRMGRGKVAAAQGFGCGSQGGLQIAHSGDGRAIS